MRTVGGVLVILLVISAPARGDSAASEIRAGRAALQSNRPREAKERFVAALAQRTVVREDQFAAEVGLGRAELWLGNYGAARAAFGKARDLATSDEDRRIASIGFARALNALEYYKCAYELAAPLAPDSADATAEAVRAASALGRADQAASHLAGCRPSQAGRRVTKDLRRLRDDVDLELSKRVDAGFALSSDSDGLEIRRYATSAWLQRKPGGDSSPVWHVVAATTDITDTGGTRHLREAAAGGTARIGEVQRLEILLGAGTVSGWSFLHGAINWDDRFTDRTIVDASVERVPILTTAAMSREILYDTFRAAVSLRPADRWYVVPVYVYQRFSDGNVRNGGSLKIIANPQDIPGAHMALGAEAYLRAFQSRGSSTGAYFSPARYRQARVSVVGVERLTSDWRVRLVAGIGSQCINGASRRSYAWSVSVFGRLPANGRIKVDFARDSFATIEGGGYEFSTESVEATIVYPF